MLLSYAHGGSTVPLIGDTVGDYSIRIATGYANNDAIVSIFEKPPTNLPRAFEIRSIGVPAR
jgi:hypothetical protein